MLIELDAAIALSLLVIALFIFSFTTIITVDSLKSEIDVIKNFQNNSACIMRVQLINNELVENCGYPFP